MRAAVIPLLVLFMLFMLGFIVGSVALLGPPVGAAIRRRRARRRNRRLRAAEETAPWKHYIQVNKNGYWLIGVERTADVGQERIVLSHHLVASLPPDYDPIERMVQTDLAKQKAQEFNDNHVRCSTTPMSDEEPGRHKPEPT